MSIFIVCGLEGPYSEKLWKQNKKKNKENVQTKKICDRAFLSPRSQFYIIQTDPKPLNSSQTKKKPLTQERWPHG